nr:Pheromone A receptor [Naematelia aurantialba]
MMRHPDYAIWTCIAFFAVVLPSPWHWRMANVSTMSLIVWLALVNLILFINTIVWRDNYEDHSPIWCDISSRLLSLVNFAIPACSLSQMMRLESVASARRSVVSASDRTRRMYREAALCIGYPLLMLPILSTVQGHRYDIYENQGCRQPFYYSWLGYLISFALPMAMSVVSCIYGGESDLDSVMFLPSDILSGLAVRWFLVRRLQFRALLASADSGLNISRYFRLVALALVEMVLLLTLNIISVVLTKPSDGLRLSNSWTTVHADYDLISQYPEGTATEQGFASNSLLIYSIVLYSIVFFVFFGMGEEAIAEYSRVWMWMLRTRRGIIHSEATPASMPSLGSKVTTASGRPWMAPSAPDDDVMFSETKLVARDDSQSMGISINVEQSVV